MRAVRIDEFGGPDVLEIADVPRPTPGPGDVLVDVRAVGVNPIDWIVRAGHADPPLSASLPWIPGWDLAGTVVATGEAVTTHEAGDRVCGMIEMPDAGETYADVATAPADEVVEIPASVSTATAGALPMVGLTAWRALYGAASVGAGDRVLVHAAAGGVGHVAVQLASLAGATVVGTASGSNEGYLRGLGAHEFVNYREQRFEAAVEEVDVVVDAIGGEVLERSAVACAPGGTVVTLPEPPSAEQTAVCEERGVDARFFSVEPDAGTLGELLDLVASGALTVTISGTYPLSDAEAAHEESEAGHVRGKLVLEPPATGGLDA